MSPKFIIDINLPDVEPENQAAACLEFLETKLEDFSTTPLTVELIPEEEKEEETAPAVKPEVKKPQPAAPAPKPTGPRKLNELYAIISRDEAGNEGICTLKGQPMVCGTVETFERFKKSLNANFMVDVPPAGMKFRCVKFIAKQELGTLK